MTRTTLVTGATAALRENAIAAAIEPDVVTALILEGLPDGTSRLDVLPAAIPLHMARIAPGCICCSGNITMRVTLNRMLRHRPAHLYIGLATASHLQNIRAFLSAPPYDSLLQLAKDLHV